MMLLTLRVHCEITGHESIGISRYFMKKGLKISAQGKGKPVAVNY